MPLILSSLIIIVAAFGGLLMSMLFIRLLFRPYSPRNIFGLHLQGIVPAVLPGLALHAANLVQQEYLSEASIAAKLNDPALMEQLKPEIEIHVDNFLKIKLKEAFPLLSNFMGEKTLAKFKEAFLTEVETILPDLLKNYSGRLVNKWHASEFISDKLNENAFKNLESSIKKKADKQIKLFYLFGAILGGCIGIIQVAITYMY